MFRKMLAAIKTILRSSLVALLIGYRYCISPLLGVGKCRFYPSCSAYALEAISMHGCAQGLWLTLKRLLKCRPGGPSGIDLVPEKTQ